MADPIVVGQRVRQRTNGLLGTVQTVMPQAALVRVKWDDRPRDDANRRETELERVSTVARGVCGSARFWPAAGEILALGAKWTREDYQRDAWPNVLAARAAGVQVLAILNPGDEFEVATPNLASVNVFEIVNEPWTGAAGLDKKTWTPKTYAATFVAMAKTIRSKRPDARIMFSSENAYTPWLADCVKAQPSLKQYVDLISCHPYTNPKRNPGLSITRLDEERKVAQALGINAPIWATEFGWTISDGYSFAEVAALYRDFLTKAARRAEWLTGLFPYQLGSQYGNAGEREQCFGLSFFTDGGPARLPAWTAVHDAFAVTA